MPIEITMPALSPTMTEGNLAKWIKKEGDKISAGDVIAEIETDKATMEVEAVDEGTLGKILVKEGTSGVAVNSVIALILEDGEDQKALDAYKPAVKKEEPAKAEAKSEAKTETKSAPATSAPSAVAPSVAPSAPKLAPQAASQVSAATQATSITSTSSDDDTIASPVARRLAQNYGIPLSAIKGTGPKGRVVKEDIEDYLATGGNGTVIRRDATPFTRFENTNIRQVIARRLLESKQQVPHFYLTIECEVDALNDIRHQVNSLAPHDESGKPAYRVSVNDLVIKATALALKKVPAANSSWYDDAIVRYNNVDISVAVATDGGLITPIVFNADQKSIFQISADVKALAKKARENKLKPEEFQGGGFSISNLGMFGIKHFSAIVNPPQSCILAVGASEEKVVIKDGSVKAIKIMTVTLSVDHRSVDGAVGAEFLSAFKRYIENPAGLLI